MIFHNHKAIFFHIAKTAGTSIERTLDYKSRDAKHFDKNVVFGLLKGIYMQHAVPSVIKRYCSDKIWHSYYKFSIVRNPYYRLLSVYFYGKTDKYKTFDNFVSNLPNILKNRRFDKGNHLTRQIDHITIDGKIVCNYIGKFENLPKSFEPIKRALN